MHMYRLFPHPYSLTCKSACFKQLICCPYRHLGLYFMGWNVQFHCCLPVCPPLPNHSASWEEKGNVRLKQEYPVWMYHSLARCDWQSCLVHVALCSLDFHHVWSVSHPGLFIYILPSPNNTLCSLYQIRTRALGVIVNQLLQSVMMMVMQRLWL